jgi:hypothetical protein
LQHSAVVDATLPRPAPVGWIAEAVAWLRPDNTPLRRCCSCYFAADNTGRRNGPDAGWRLTAWPRIGWSAQWE